MALLIEASKSLVLAYSSSKVIIAVTSRLNCSAALNKADITVAVFLKATPAILSYALSGVLFLFVNTEVLVSVVTPRSTSSLKAFSNKGLPLTIRELPRDGAVSTTSPLGSTLVILIDFQIFKYLANLTAVLAYPYS